jgi:hypothetical protein
VYRRIYYAEEHKNGSVFNAPTLRRLAILAGKGLFRV